MKPILIILVALLMLVVPAVVTAQITPAYKSLCDTKTYVNDQNDTLPANIVNYPTGKNTGIRIASASLISTYFAAYDSVEAIRYFQYRPMNGVTWTTLYVDSTTSLAGTAAIPTVDEDMIRSTALDRWTYAYGIGGYVRMVIVFGPTKNGTNTVAAPTTYTAGFYYRP
jgi:hypothetical protein